MQCGTWQEVRCSGPVVLFSYFFSLKGSEGSGGLGMWHQITSLGLWGHPKVAHDSGCPESIRHPREPAVFLATADPVLRGSGSGSTSTRWWGLMVWCELRPLLHAPHLSPWASVCSALKLTREGMRKGKTIIYCFIWPGKLIQHLPLLCWSQELNHESDSRWLCSYIVYSLVGETDKRNQEAGEYIIQTTEIKNNRRQGIESLLDRVVRESLSEEVSFELIFEWGQKAVWVLSKVPCGEGI